MKPKYVLTLQLGMILLAIAIIMVKIVPANNFTDFEEGMLIGMTVMP